MSTRHPLGKSHLPPVPPLWSFYDIRVMQVCPELRLLEAVTLWAQHQDVEAEERVNALSQLLPLIRFPLMSSEELQVGSPRHPRNLENNNRFSRCATGTWGL